MKIVSHRTPGGSALLIVLITTAIIGLGLASYLALISQQNVSVMRSQSWNAAMPLLESGVEEALTHVNVNAITNLGVDGWTLAGSLYSRERQMDPGYYVVGISNVNPPVVYASGYVRSPTSTNYLPPRTVMVRTRRDAMFGRGMVAKGTIDMSGNNVRSDSFDSKDPAYSTNGRYDSAKSKDNGDVATNSGLINSLSVGNANIYGHASTGPGGSISVGSNGAVGSRVWQAAGNKGIQPGWSSDDMNAAFPDVKVPFTTGLSPSSGHVGTTNYDFILGTGNYVMSELELRGEDKFMLVAGHAVLYVIGEVSISGKGAIIIATNNASLKMYVGGPSASLGGNGLVNGSGDATKFTLFGLPSLASLGFSGNAAFVGAIYAPSASFSLGGGGSTTTDFIGSSVTGSVRLNGHFNFHYDENLSREGPSRGFVVASWDELTNP
jgi:hypothetical protein